MLNSKIFNDYLPTDHSYSLEVIGILNSVFKIILNVRTAAAELQLIGESNRFFLRPVYWFPIVLDVYSNISQFSSHLPLDTASLLSGQDCLPWSLRLSLWH